MKISAVIITFNEEENIGDAIRSVDWADEILVVDSESTDRTCEIAEALGARVIAQSWLGFSAQKQFAVDSALNDWILSLDADERVTPELRIEIEALNEDANTRAYSVPRLSVYMGREIRHGGWFPDRQVRLFDRRRGRWNERLVHESFQLKDGARPGQLAGHLLHFSVKSPAHHARMIADRYAPLTAAQAFSEGKRTNAFKVAVSGSVAFIRSYFLKLGFLDGFPGYCIAAFAAHHARLKHMLLRDLWADADKD